MGPLPGNLICKMLIYYFLGIQTYVTEKQGGPQIGWLAVQVIRVIIKCSVEGEWGGVIAMKKDHESCF